MLSVNGDIMIRSFVLLFAFAFFTSRGAAAGDVVLAANQVLLTLFFVGSYFLDGLATAAEQFAGRAIGARYRPAFERSLVLSVTWGFVVAALLSAILWFAGPAIVDLLTTNTNVRAVALAFLPYAALTPLIGTLAFQMDGVFIGATMVARHAQYDAAVGRHLSDRVVGPGAGPRYGRTVDCAARVSRHSRYCASADLLAPNRPGVS